MIDNSYSVEGQMSILDLDPDIWCGKTFQEPYHQESPKEQTSKSSSRKSSKSSKQMPMMCLCLRGGRWPKAGVIYGVGDDGYPFSVAWKLHDAQYWGVPQRRKRLALVGDFNGLTAGEILFDPQYRREAESSESDISERHLGTQRRQEVQPESESMSGNSNESEQERQGTAASSERSTGKPSGVYYLERDLFTEDTIN